MKNENIQTIARALNRAGLVGINPPPRFIEDVCPALWTCATRFRSLMIRPACPFRSAAMRSALLRAARRFEWFADLAPCGLTKEQGEELRDIARDLRAALSDKCPANLPFGGGALS